MFQLSLEDLRAFIGGAAVDRAELFFGPEWRPQRRDQPFDLLQARPVDRRSIALVQDSDRIGDLNMPEHAHDLADIPNQAEDVSRTAALRYTEPLHFVLLVGVPQERIAHRGIGGFREGRGIVQILNLGRIPVHLVDDRPDGVKLTEQIPHREKLQKPAAGT